MTESPYLVGQRLRLQLSGSTQVDVKLERIYEPFPMSVVALVSLPPDCPSAFKTLDGDAVILKLYDRRFASDLRSAHGSKDFYNSKVEIPYLQHLLHDPPTAAEIKQDYRDLEDRLWEELGRAEEDAKMAERALDRKEDAQADDSENGDEFSRLAPAASLRVIQNCCLQLAETEEKIYGCLKPLQDVGKIPTFFTSATLMVDTQPQLPSILTNEQAELINQYYRIPAIFISYVPGHLLSKIRENEPEKDWKHIVDLAMEVVNNFGDHNVLNRDVRPKNIIVQKIDTGEGHSYNAVAIDLAQSQVRRDDETDEEWKENKRLEDEESAIGLRMYRELGFGKYLYPGPGQARYDDQHVPDDAETGDAGADEDSPAEDEDGDVASEATMDSDRAHVDTEIDACLQD